jgi:hypothetical protein
MAWTYTVKEDGRAWFLIDNHDVWMDYTGGQAEFEPTQYPCLACEKIVEGYCKKESEFFVRYDV